jgi:NTE family protein
MRGLVLSGGGPLAVAWESGLVAGLAAEGVTVARADVTIGTSAGAIVGAQLASGAEPAVLAEAILEERNRKPPPGAMGRHSPEVLSRLPSLFQLAHSGAGDPAKSRAEVGAYALAAPTESDEAWVGRMALVLRGAEWSERVFQCVAVDADDGSIVLLGRDCGAPLARAVAASCSLPGISPPVEIGGRRFIDGGFASSANAELAKGCEKVLVIAFHPTGPAAERIKTRLESQLQVLRATGAVVLALYPDAESLAAIGSRMMDMRGRPEIAEAGLAQGRAAAASVAEFWS